MCCVGAAVGDGEAALDFDVYGFMSGRHGQMLCMRRHGGKASFSVLHVWQGEAGWGLSSREVSNFEVLKESRRWRSSNLHPSRKLPVQCARSCGFSTLSLPSQLIVAFIREYPISCIVNTLESDAPTVRRCGSSLFLTPTTCPCLLVPVSRALPYLLALVARALPHVFPLRATSTGELGLDVFFGTRTDSATVRAASPGELRSPHLLIRPGVCAVRTVLSDDVTQNVHTNTRKHTNANTSTQTHKHTVARSVQLG